MSDVSAADPGILDSVGRIDRQNVHSIDFDLSVARTGEQLTIPISTQLCVDPRAFDGPTTFSTTLSVGNLFVTVQTVASSPVRMEPGFKFTIPPTTKLIINNPAQSGFMARLYCMPRAYSMSYYQRFDAPSVSPATVIQTTVTSSFAQIVPAAPGRASVSIQNANAVGSASMFIAPTNAVTIANGLEVSPKQVWTISDSTTSWFAVTSAGVTADARILTEG